VPVPNTSLLYKYNKKGDGGPGTRNSHLRQMSSFERLSNTLSNFIPSTSSNTTSHIALSSVLDSGDEGKEIDLEWQAGGMIRVCRNSMPGSLLGNLDNKKDEHDHGDEEGEGSEVEDDYGYNAELEEQTFDDDIFATGEMENMPFL